MTDKLVSEADAIRRERAAARRVLRVESKYENDPASVEVLVNHYYPLPRKTVPRVVPGTRMRWRWTPTLGLEGTAIANGPDADGWTPHLFIADDERAAVASLLANPTVEVDADD